MVVEAERALVDPELGLAGSMSADGDTRGLGVLLALVLDLAAVRANGCHTIWLLIC
jgi:electron transfer flavoprotein alpha/beta subunit